MNFFKSKLILTKSSVAGFLFFSLFMLTPNLALAATAYLTPSFKTVAVGDTVIVNVEMDTAGKNPNVVEGNIAIKSGAEKIQISAFSVAGSVLALWPKNPSFDLANESLISFAGGTPGGFDQASGLLFKIVFLAEKEGQVVFSPTNFKAYDNDGQATPIEVFHNPLTIEIGPKGDLAPQDQWLEVVTQDHIPPQDLIATIGQDASIFDGKKFISISVVDDQSGIAYYEVKEGDRPVVRSEATYVLLDQDGSSAITITAYDKAGNYSRITLPPGKPKINYVELIASLILFVALLYILFRLFKFLKKRKIKDINE
jgi:hypothetical protein